MIARTLPQAVENYLGTRFIETRSMAYFRLNDKRCLDLCGGDLRQCGLDSVNRLSPIDEQIDMLIGLLPIRHPPVVIRNAQNDSSSFYDLHLFLDDERQWIVIFDNTEAALKLQIEQQDRLSSDIIRERSGI